MSTEHKEKWICQACRSSLPKRGNTNTPIRPFVSELPTLPVQLDKPKTDNTNVTVRKRNINSPCQYSDESFLIDQEGDTITNYSEENVLTHEIQEPPTLQQISLLLDKKLTEQKSLIIADIESKIKCSIDSSIRQEISNAIAEIKSEFTNRTDALSFQQTSLKKEIDALSAKISTLELDKNKLTGEIKNLQINNTIVNTQGKNNDKDNEKDNNKKIVLYGLEEFSWETETDLYNRIAEMFWHIMEVNLDGQIEDLVRLGKKGNRRPLIIELISKKTTKYILQNHRLFKNSGFSISPVLDREALRERQDLVKILFEERKNGNHAIIRNNTLYINGKKYYASNTNKHRQTKADETLLNEQAKNFRDF